jgi:type II secretory ATPase GspE/PulE/Tfp pilus assembly ATPase PilB-like protein
VLERGLGCKKCRETGYRGRTGIFELLVMSDELRQSLLGPLDLTTLRRAARVAGMRTLRQDAWAKVQAGITTVEEVLRVVQD